MLRSIVVDDHPASRTFLRHVLSSEHFEPLVAQSAEEALAAYDQQPIDIWFVDWVMPGMSGLELVQQLRNRPGGDRAYVIMLTAKNSDEDLATAFAAGVDDFIRKPLSALELDARLKAAVRLVTTSNCLKQRLDEIEALNTSLTELNRELEVMASTDALTGLLNRRAGMQALGEMWSTAVRYSRPLSVAVIDIDHFKRINDLFGHARGDAALRHVATVLDELARNADKVARIGGEEFLVVLPETDTASAAIYLDRCRAEVSKVRCIADGHDVPLAISAGVAMRDASIESAEELVKIADAALYEAKRQGRNRVVQAPAKHALAHAS